MTRRQNQQKIERNTNVMNHALIWRWHFYSGIFVVPFLLILSLTGLVMLFDDEIEQARYHDIITVVPSEDSVPVSQQMDSVNSQYPEAKITQFIPAKTSDAANRFSIQQPSGETQFITVDPYSGQLLGAIDRSDSWYELANNIHGTLLMGQWGDYLIEIAASLSVILLVTGVYLWLPLTNASKAGFMKIRITSSPRIVLRDIHSNVGGLLSVFLLFFLLSGLAWTTIWGDKFVQTWSSFPAEKWDNVPLSEENHAAMNHGSEEELPWNLENTPLPLSHKPTATSNQVYDIDKLVLKAEALGFTAFKLNLPRDKTGVYTVTANTMSGDVSDPRLDRTTHFDQYTGEVLADVQWQDYSVMAKAMAAGIALHQGDMSVINKIANVFICLVFIFIAVSGAVMWWIRKPKEKTVGAPPKIIREDLWPMGLITLVLLSLAFPLAGLTIFVAFTLDYLIFSRFKSLEHVFN